METSFAAPDNNEVLMVKLGHKTSLVAYSTDKHSMSHSCHCGLVWGGAREELGMRWGGAGQEPGLDSDLSSELSFLLVK